jgi:hypothetical protein
MGAQLPVLSGLLFPIMADMADPDDDLDEVALNVLLAEDQLDQAMLNQRLLNLRRRGQANGGLPRLERFGCKSE